MKKFRIIFIMLLLLCACSRESIEQLSDAPDDIRLNAMLTKATAESTDASSLTSPQFIIWDATNFEASPQTLATPFIAQIPDETIDSYASTKYNTFVHYPDNNELVYATGFWPSPVTSGTGLTFTSGSDYTSFDIPEDWVGKKDILVASSVITGNEGSPFSTPLTFIHAQSKITIVAKLASDMSKFVKNVTVEFTNPSRPERLVWSQSAGRYVVTGGRTSGALVTDSGQTSTQQLSKDRTQSVDEIYLVPNTAYEANVKFWMADESTGFDTSNYSVKQSGNITIPVTLEAGDSYTLTLEFGVNVINLYGRLKPWEDGGYVTVPIKIATN